MTRLWTVTNSATETHRNQQPSLISQKNASSEVPVNRQHHLAVLLVLPLPVRTITNLLWRVRRNWQAPMPRLQWRQRQIPVATPTQIGKVIFLNPYIRYLHKINICLVLVKYYHSKKTWENVLIKQIKRYEYWVVLYITRKSYSTSFRRWNNFIVLINYNECDYFFNFYMELVFLITMKILLWYTFINNNEFSRLLHIFTTVFLICSYSRFRRTHSDPDQNFLSTDSHSGYPRFVSSPYAHPFFKQDFRDRSYDMTQFPRNHSYPQTPSASSPPHVTIKQEPKDQGFETSGKFQIKSV